MQIRIFCAFERAVAVLYPSAFVFDGALAPLFNGCSTNESLGGIVSYVCVNIRQAATSNALEPERRTPCFINGVDSCMASVSLLPAKRLKRLEVEGGRLAKYLTNTNKI